jgi:hypothetical protein
MMPRDFDREIEQAKNAVEALEAEKLSQQYDGVVDSVYTHERGMTFVVKSVALVVTPKSPDVPVPAAIGVLKNPLTIGLDELTTKWVKK